MAITVVVGVDPDGFRASAVFESRFRLDGHRDRKGNWVFDLLEK
jgi:hypothetical protein